MNTQHNQIKLKAMESRLNYHYARHVRAVKKIEVIKDEIEELQDKIVKLKLQMGILR